MPVLNEEPQILSMLFLWGLIMTIILQQSNNSIQTVFQQLYLFCDTKPDSNTDNGAVYFS